MKARCYLPCAVSLAICAVAGITSAASITHLPAWLAAPTIRHLSMLADGQTFIGVEDADVFRWSQATGRTNLGTIPREHLGQTLKLHDVSSDGTTVLGYVGDSPGSAFAGFTWNASSGMIFMPNSNDGLIHHSVPLAVSADGKVIVGYARQPATTGFGESELVAFRWTAETGVQSLGFAGYPTAISANGSTIVGSRPLTQITSEAIRWTEAEGVVGLGHFPSTLQSSSASHISNDGSIVIGGSFGAAPVIGPKAFRWTEHEGLQQLTTRGNDQSVIAISGDAKVMVGTMRTLLDDVPNFAPINENFLWTAEAGLKTLSELLSELGLSQQLPTNAENTYPSFYALSDNGEKVFGATTELIYADGPAIPNFPQIPSIKIEYWLLDISAVPEPASCGLLLIASATMMAQGRCRKFTNS